MAIWYTNVETRVITELQETTPGTHWGRPEMLTAVGDAVEDLQYDAHQIKTNKVFTVNPHNRYTNPTGVLLYTSGWYDNDDNEIRFLARPDLAEVDFGTNVVGTPRYAVEDGTDGEFRLYPAGSDTNKTFKMIFVKALTFSSTNSSVALRDHRYMRRALAFKTMYHLLRREGKNKDAGKAEYYNSLYREELQGKDARSPFERELKIWPGGKTDAPTREDYGVEI